MTIEREAKSTSYIESAIDRFLKSLEPFSPEVTIHPPKPQNILNFIAGPNLSGADVGLPETPIERAREFILNRAEIFGLEKNWLAAHLQHKATLESRMGKHVIFNLVYYGREIEEQAFVVHLDARNRVVMVSADYSGAEIAGMLKPPGRDLNPQVFELLMNKVKENLRAENLTGPWKFAVEQHMIPIWWEQSKLYRDGLQIKASNGHGRIFTIYAVLDENGEPHIEKFPLSYAASDERYLAQGFIYKEFWTPRAMGQKLNESTLEGILVGEKDASGFPKKLKYALLRGLVGANRFEGTYVRVEDSRQEGLNIITGNLDGQDVTFDERMYSVISELEPETDWTNQFLDPMMAYYHIDLIQRYFRGLGFAWLDKREGFTPIVVTLGNSSEGEDEFDPVTGMIRIRLVLNGQLATFAREPRILYHEYVHAVTDAIARIQRADKQHIAPLTRIQVFQAAAMDEGFADYFACSLAASQGAKRAVFYVLRDPNEETDPNTPHVQVTSFRDLEVTEQDAAYHTDIEGMLGQIKSGAAPAKIHYQWSQVWSRYLWSLRQDIAPEIADAIIAHSFFFLSRWAIFEQGILALIVADYMLFGRNSQASDPESLFSAPHESIIRAKIPKDRAGVPIWTIHRAQFDASTSREMANPAPMTVGMEYPKGGVMTQA